MVLGLLLVGLSEQQARAEIRKIQIQDAIEIALQHNLEVQRFENQTNKFRVSFQQSQSGYYPDASATLRSLLGYSGRSDPQSGASGGGTYGALSVGANSSWNLFHGFYDRSAVAQSRLDLVASELSLVRLRQEVVFETINRYTQVLVDQELIRADEESLAAQRKQLDLIQAFFERGKRPLADLYQQKAEVARAELKLLRSKSNWAVGKLMLLQILGLDARTDVAVTPFDMKARVASLRRNKIPILAKPTPSLRPDQTAQEKRIQAAGKGVEKSQAGYWPQLALVLDLGTNYTSGGNGSPTVFADQFFDKNLTAVVGLQLSIPIFDRFVTQRAVEQAKLDLNEQTLAAQSMQQQIDVELGQAREHFQTAKKQLDVAESQKQYAEQSLAAFEERYNVNASTLVELTQARARLQESIYDEIEAKYGLLLRAIAILYYQGDQEGMIGFLKD